MRFSLSHALITVILGVSLFPSQSQAAIIFNNFGVEDVYSIAGGRSISGPDSPISEHIQGFQFFSSSSGNLGSIEVAIGLGSGLNKVTFELREDSGLNTPNFNSSGLLESFDFVDEMGTFRLNNPPILGQSVLEPELLTETPYWLIARSSANTLAFWNTNSVGDRGLLYLNVNGGQVFQSDRSVFRITTTTAVPEPVTILGTFAAFGIGIMIKRNRNT